MKQFLTVLLIAITFSGCDNNPEPIDPQRLGQMVLIGFRGTEVDSNHPVIRDLKDLNVAGVILYDQDYLLKDSSRNIESQDQLLKLSSDLISNAFTPPIIALHQDGSSKAPLHSLYDISEFTGTRFLSDSVSAQQYSRLFAQEFMVLGLNTNFNPRIDLRTGNTKDHPELISSEASEVTKQAGIILDEYDSERMFSALKYFPGYSTGYADTDIADDITDQWNEDFLIPYERLLQDRQINGIMTAHSFNAHIDSTWPGTLSEKTITGLLRDSLGFDGVIISDDLQKPILTEHYELETIIAQALNAGVDILLFGNNYEYQEDQAAIVINTIQKLIADGRVPREKVLAALDRIDTLKDDVIADLCTCMNF